MQMRVHAHEHTQRRLPANEPLQRGYEVQVYAGWQLAACVLQMSTGIVLGAASMPPEPLKTVKLMGISVCTIGLILSTCAGFQLRITFCSRCIGPTTSSCCRSWRSLSVGHHRWCLTCSPCLHLTWKMKKERTWSNGDGSWQMARLLCCRAMFGELRLVCFSVLFGIQRRNLSQFKGTTEIFTYD